MPVYPNKKTGRIFVQFDYKSQTYKKTMPVDCTPAHARDFEIKWKAKLFDEANGLAPKPTAEGVLFEDYVDNVYLPSILATQGQAAHDRAEDLMICAIPFCKGKKLDEIKASDIKRIKELRTALKFKRGEKLYERKPATIRREMAIISKMFSDAVDDDICEYNPCSRVKLPRVDNKQDRVLEWGDDDKFFAAFDREQGMTAHDVCLLVLNTGLSQKDVLNLDPFKISVRDKKLVLNRSKTQQRLEIPLNDDAFRIITARLKDGPLFISQKTGAVQKSVKTAMAGACRRAKIPRLTIRDLRRTFGTRLHDEGVDAWDIAQLLGHADLRMIPRYVRTTKNRRKAVEKLNKPAQILPTIFGQAVK